MPDFVRPRHRLVRQVLERLDRRFLASIGCWFGGGTRIVLALDEYRESVDVDFLCADLAGYRTLRSSITQASLGPVFAEPCELAREVRADRYGIRTWLRVAGEPLKFEIVSEGRVALGGITDDTFPVDVLDRASCLVEKLLANTDRGRDASTHARDLIDLAFMAEGWPDEDLPRAVRLAEEAYGTSVRRELAFTLERFADDDFRNRCTRALAVSGEDRLDAGLVRLASLPTGEPSSG